MYGDRVSKRQDIRLSVISIEVHGCPDGQNCWTVLLMKVVLHNDTDSQDCQK